MIPRVLVMECGMKVWELGEQKGIASLRMVERAEPKPGPGQALIAVKAPALHRRGKR